VPSGATCARIVAAASSTEIIVYVAMPASGSGQLSANSRQPAAAS
jgi:hypothetical protein